MFAGQKMLARILKTVWFNSNEIALRRGCKVIASEKILQDRIKSSFKKKR
jgi:hypothetical protein